MYASRYEVFKFRSVIYKQANSNYYNYHSWQQLRLYLEGRNSINLTVSLSVKKKNLFVSFFEIWVAMTLIWVVRWVFEWWFVIFWRHVTMNVQNSITTQSRRSCWKNTDPPLSRESSRSWVRFALNFFFCKRERQMER